MTNGKGRIFVANIYYGCETNGEMVVYFVKAGTIRSKYWIKIGREIESDDRRGIPVGITSGSNGGIKVMTMGGN